MIDRPRLLERGRVRSRVRLFTCSSQRILRGAHWEEEVPMSAGTVREEAHRLVDQLPEDATWEDLLYQIYIRQTIEAGLEDCRAGRLISVDEVKRRLGLPT